MTRRMVSRVAMPRVLLLLFVLCLTTMMFISRCGFDFEAPSGGQAGMRRSLEALPRDADTMPSQVRLLIHCSITNPTMLILFIVYVYNV